MTVTFRLIAKGHREFDVAGRRYRAFWLSLGHNWSLREVGLDGLPVLRADGTVGKWEPKNWKELESFVAWRAKESGADVGELKIVPLKGKA